jgi:hypothetical protein
MATKTLSRRAEPTTAVKNLHDGSQVTRLHHLIERQQALAKELLDFMEELEEAEDSRRLDAAIKENAGKPGIPWAEAKKKLGLV